MKTPESPRSENLQHLLVMFRLPRWRDWVSGVSNGIMGLFLGTNSDPVPALSQNPSLLVSGSGSRPQLRPV